MANAELTGDPRICDCFVLASYLIRPQLTLGIIQQQTSRMSKPITTHRFDEAGQPRWFREGRHLVVCPRCARQAIVEVIGWRPGYWPTGTRLTCLRCGYALQRSYGTTTPWNGPVHVSVRSHCANCGRPLVRAIGHRAAPPKRRTIDLRCPDCAHVSRRSLVITPTAQWRPVDPYFGHPLWLQTPCCGHVLWAANEAHLQMLANYVGAALRERKPNANTSTVSRLPTWIKQGKHRRAILTCIRRLQASLTASELRRAAV